MALQAEGEIARPVDVARLLVAAGLSLRKAHEVLGRIVAGRRAFLELRTLDVAVLRADFAKLGIAVRALERPTVDVSAVRRSLGLSQIEFAYRFGLEPDTVQNWEQGRNKLDPAVRVLLRLIERWPSLVEAAAGGMEDADPPDDRSAVRRTDERVQLVEE